MDIGAGLLGLLFAYKTVKNVEGIEEEVRVYLVLQLEVTVFGYIGQAHGLLGFASGFQGVVDHEHYAVESDFRKEGGHEQDGELIVES